jgi:hypothetical protein
LARIIIIQHRTLGSDFPRSMLSLLAGYWAEWGHQIFVASGTEGLPEADLAVLHVNLSRIPQHYADAASPLQAGGERGRPGHSQADGEL